MINKVGIIGAGTMGFGIAYHFLTKGVPVILNDTNEDSLATVEARLKKYFKVFQEEGTLYNYSEEEIIGNLTLTININELSSCDFIIESATENLNLKQKIFMELEGICNENTILASNTSSLKLSDIIKNIKNKKRILLTHFFNPAHIVPLVELCKTTETNSEIYKEVEQFMKDMGKVTIEVKKELPGLVANRIQAALAREALSLLEDDIVSEEDLEKAIFAGPGFRYATSGILKIMDLAGLDIWNIVLEQLQPEIESGIRRFSTIVDKVEKGNLGAKTSQGFFEYPGKILDEFIIERDRILIQQLKIFEKINGGNNYA